MELNKGQIIDVTDIFANVDIEAKTIKRIINIGQKECFDIKTKSGWFLTTNNIICKQCAGWSLGALLREGIKAVVPEQQMISDDEILLEMDDGFTYAVKKTDKVLVKRNSELYTINAEDIQPDDEIISLAKGDE